jgi:hypothetical protein
MGTDWVRLFKKRLCDEIVALDPSGLATFLSCHLADLDEHSEFCYGFAESLPAPDRLRQLQASGLSEQELKRSLVDSLCVFGEWLYLDYWACYTEVFVSNPAGSIADLDIFPHLREQRFLLLRPEHVDQMIESLDAHRAGVRMMQEKDVLLLMHWRDQCLNDPTTMVAYFLDH